MTAPNLSQRQPGALPRPAKQRVSVNVLIDEHVPSRLPAGQKERASWGPPPVPPAWPPPWHAAVP